MRFKYHLLYSVDNLTELLYFGRKMHIILFCTLMIFYL